MQTFSSPQHFRLPPTARTWSIVVSAVLLGGLVVALSIATVLTWTSRLNTPTNTPPPTAFPVTSANPRFSALPIENNFRHVKDRDQISLTLGDAEPIIVEVVTQPASITQGLSGRAELGADGMLFVLGQSYVPRFWMKEMRFDLDLVWIAAGRVVAITPNVPAPEPTTPLSQLPQYNPPQPVNMVLEIPAGQAERRGIMVGDELKL